MIAFYDAVSQELHILSDAEGHDTTDWVEVALPADYDERVHRFDGSAWTIDFAALDAALHRMIDNGAGEFRLKFITDVPGQQAVYLAKEEEALNWSVASLLGSAPYLEAEAEARGISIAEQAAMILAISTDWKALSVAIEATRIAAKEAVTTADSVAAKESAANVNWASLLVN